MQVRITIDVDNDAFQNSPELWRVLKSTAEESLNMPLIAGTFKHILDINGNKVGKMEVIE